YALADYLNRDLGHVREGICVESSDLEELRYSMREKWRPGANPSTTRTEKYNLLVRDAQDPEVARWMRLRLTDYSGAELCQPSLTPELLKNLRAARALLFLVDHRSLPDLLPHDALPVTAGDNQRDAEELAAQYTRILQRYFDVNKDSLHLPVGLVVNKSDLLLG